MYITSSVIFDSYISHVFNRRFEPDLSVNVAETNPLNNSLLHEATVEAKKKLC